MSIYWNELSTTEYDDQLYQLIKNVEESGAPNPHAYDDGEGNPTIGLGFNLTVASVRDTVIEALLYPDAPPTAQQRLNDASYIDQIVSAINHDDYALLNSVMAARAANPNNTYSNKYVEFKFDNENQIKAVFITISSNYEARVDSWWSAFPPSQTGVIPRSTERLALLSLAYNSKVGETDLLGEALKKAIVAGNHAEAWYEIRYNSNGGTPMVMMQ